MISFVLREHAEQRVFGHVGALKKFKEKNPKMIIGVCDSKPFLSGQRHGTGNRFGRESPPIAVLYNTARCDPSNLFQQGRAGVQDTNRMVIRIRMVYCVAQLVDNSGLVFRPLLWTTFSQRSSSNTAEPVLAGDTRIVLNNRTLEVEAGPVTPSKVAQIFGGYRRPS